MLKVPQGRNIGNNENGIKKVVKKEAGVSMAKAVLSAHVKVWLPADGANALKTIKKGFRQQLKWWQVCFILPVTTRTVATNLCCAAGYLNNSDGSLNNRGSNGNYWSSTQNSTTNGWNLNFNSGNSNMNNNNKANGFTLRCLRDYSFYHCPHP